MALELYNALARLLSYPEQQNVPDDIFIDEHIAAEIAAFAALTRSLSLEQLQELFIQTFDLNPVCSLEMGWHLFGENYDRGLLLVKMRQQLRVHQIPETTELPDHLTNGLRLLARMDRSAASYLAEAVVLPALEKMLAAIQDKQNPYEHVLKAARLLVRTEFPEIPSAAETELRVLA